MRRAVAAGHDGIDEVRDQGAVVPDIRQTLALGCSVAT
jgi:hypothetical protein